MPQTAEEIAQQSNRRGSVPVLSANELRYLAEKADGLRTQDLSLIIDGNTVDVVATKDVGARKVLLNLKTPSRGPGVPGDAKIEIHWRGKTYGGPDSALDKADAVFVTQSSIEKFLLPYYMRFKSAAAVQALENSLFNDRNVAAALHIPPSIALKFPGQALQAGPGKDECDMGKVGLVCRDEASGELISVMV